MPSEREPGTARGADLLGDPDAAVRARRRREALDTIGLERKREEAIVPRLEAALRDARLARADAHAFARMTAEDVAVLRRTGFASPERAPDAQARLDARAAELIAELEECRAKQRALARFADALVEGR